MTNRYDKKRAVQRMSTSLARPERDIQQRSSGVSPVFERLVELEQRVLAMDKQVLPVARAKDHPEAQPLRQNVSGIRTLDDFEARLPQLIEKEVNARFQQMTATLQREVEETNIRAIETFVKNVQSKLVQRISLLEANMNKQAQTMCELRECSRRTEDNLVRLISGVEKLARELPARIPARS